VLARGLCKVGLVLGCQQCGEQLLGVEGGAWSKNRGRGKGSGSVGLGLLSSLESKL
jgi:hypothetical protein